VALDARRTNWQPGAVTIDEFAAALSSLVNGPVIDKTGLAEHFDLDLTWTPDQLRDLSSTSDRVNGASFDTNGPSIFTALREQLGLKLESATGPVDVLVIDSVERPAED
jgi:uncharacterized protein (TIGR03435 family)